jgi:hypothetical protein
MVKKGFTWILLMILLTLSVFGLNEFYQIDDILKISSAQLGNYDFLKIETPSQTFMQQNNNEDFFLELQEEGRYVIQPRPDNGKQIELIVLGKNIEESFKLISPIEESNSEEYFIEIGKLARNIKILSPGQKEIRIPKISQNISVYGSSYYEKKSIFSFFKEDKSIIIENPSSEIEVHYYTPGPEKTEKIISKNKKEVTISSDFHYENVLAETSLPREVTSSENIKIFWKEKGIYLDFELIDSDENGRFDKVRWIVPHLSTQTFEIIIEITSAEHLDAERNFIEDIYEKVYQKDGIWAFVPDQNFVRVTFEENLSSENDITVYAKSSTENPATIEIYEKNSLNKIAEIKNILSEGFYKVLLTSLLIPQSTFDLKILGGILIDLIIDPVAAPGASVELRAQSCARQSLQDTRNTFDLSCEGTYPSSCGSSGDRISCDDTNYETGQSYRFGGTHQYGGIRIETYNSAITDCNSITSVQICYKFWRSLSTGSTCYVDTSANGGTSWQSNTVTCASSEAASPTCINVTSNSTWQCSHFFGSSGTRAMARSQAYSAANRETYTWNFDVLYYNVTYQTPPLGALSVLLNSPANQQILNSFNVNFNFTPSSSGNFVNCSLWDNSTGVWHRNQTNQTTILNATANFINKTYTQSGNYLWNVQCCDNSNGCVFLFQTEHFLLT